MERDKQVADDLKEYSDFNSHAHVERDLKLDPNNVTLVISTHTLTWSVTDEAGALNFNKKISTHTLTWSVTVIYFNLDIFVIISTHTLTWSVTRSLWMMMNDKEHFNSHAHVERDI